MIFVEHLRLYYVFDEILPSTATDTEQVVNTVAALARRGHQVVLGLPHMEGRTVPTSSRLREYYQVRGTFDVTTVPTHMDRVRPLQKAFHAWQATRLDASRHADAMYTRNLPALHAAVSRGQPVFYEHYRAWPEQYPPLVPWLRWMLLNPTCLGIVLHSEHARRSFMRIGIPETKLTVVHNGYSPELLEPRLDAARARRQLGFALDRPLAVYAGRINPQKGLESVLELARACPEADFALVGSEGSGPIEQTAATLDNVHVFPWLPFDQVVPYLYAADILLIPPSLAPLERFGTTVLPMKLFRYLAMGRAILGPRAADTAEILKHDHNAWLVDPSNPAAIVQGFRELLEAPERRDRLGAQAQRDAEDLTWDARAQRLEQFLSERLEAGPSHLHHSDCWDPSQWAQDTLVWTSRRIGSWFQH